VIAAAAGNLKTGCLNTDDCREQSALILSETGRLNWMLQNILEMGRIDTNAVAAERAWCDASEIVTAARLQVEHALQEHRLEVTTELEAPVQLSPRLTASALAHLVENAAQYAPAGSAIEVVIRMAGDELVIEVRDRGPGIDLMDLPHLFERCYRGTHGKARRPGTGMGLWISKRLVSAQHGRIWAENRPSGGAQFTIAVPTTPPEAEAAACVGF
jgi:two-component system sensor histidine kinase KdpD